MISLGAIILDDNLRLEGDLSQAGFAGSARQTMGMVVIQSMPLQVGKTLTLVAAAESDTVHGIYTRSQLQQVVALRDAGAPVTLVHHLGTWQVWLPPDAVSVTQVFDYADPDADAWYTGTITMITV